MFPKTSPRKKIEITIRTRRSNKALESVLVTGARTTPLIIHKNVYVGREGELVESKEWTITHEFTGLNLGVSGRYKFCKAVAEDLSEETALWMLSPEMVANHPTYQQLTDKRSKSMREHYHLK
jgi:hypothetical protein